MKHPRRGTRAGATEPDPQKRLMADRPRPRGGDNREGRPARGRPTEDRRPTRPSTMRPDDLSELADELEECGRSLIQHARRLQRLAERMEQTGGDAPRPRTGGSDAPRPRTGGSDAPRPRAGGSGGPRRGGGGSSGGSRYESSEGGQRRERPEGGKRPDRGGEKTPEWAPKKGPRKRGS